ncbi:LuxR family two component transcriptional regulator [Mesocricetibacter intestinalis]|uniref:Transcriptional regulatory protein UhpA n=1 Tax=Mesocricetibacter intestinalis TaxID=1521930 RepID=A0A4R6VAC6_9PAST|nr:response regulator [Mesocricetibacter intestinalis]TDQ57010.1 LuxR family two component transcriptional regulator [Mesocricetibacter intestinalis]
MINIILIDDHIIVRSGFSQLLALEENIRVVAEFGSVQEARQKLPACKADICIMDISMPDESGLDLLKEMPSGLHCIMLSVNDSAVIIKKALELGAKGYLSKRCNPLELIQAVKTVYAGGIYLMPELMSKLVADKQDLSQTLTKREYQICELLNTGLTAKEIAEKLSLSVKTVYVHRDNAMSKLNVKNNVELANLFRLQE